MGTWNQNVFYNICTNAINRDVFFKNFSGNNLVWLVSTNCHGNQFLICPSANIVVDKQKVMVQV